jgi:hypothetical protein
MINPPLQGMYRIFLVEGQSTEGKILLRILVKDEGLQKKWDKEIFGWGLQQTC